MILDDKLYNDIDNRPVYYNVYAYYDTQTKLFNIPIISEQQLEMVVAGAKASYFKDDATRIKLTGLQLCILGKYECRTGKFELLDDCVCILDFTKLKVEDPK